MNYEGIGIPAGMESDEDIDAQDDEMMPDFIAEQFGHHGWNVNNMAHLFDGLDLAEFDIDDDDFLDDDDDEWFDEYYDSDFDYEDNEDRRKYVTGIFKVLFNFFFNFREFSEFWWFFVDFLILSILSIF